MKKNLLSSIVFIVLFYVKAFCADPPSDTTITAFIGKETFANALKAKNFKLIIDSAGDKLKVHSKTEYSKVFDSDKNIRRNAAVILIFNPVNKECLDETQVKKIVCSRGKKKKGKVTISTEEYLLAKRNVMIIFIGNTVKSDGIKVDLKDSYFKNSFNELKDLVVSVMGGGSDTSYAGRIVYLGKKDINSPCTITANVPYKKPLTADTLYNKNFGVTLKSADQDVDMIISPSQFKLNFDKAPVKTDLNIEYKLDGKDKTLELQLPGYYFYRSDKKTIKQEIHERNFLAFSVGGSLSKLNLKQFSMKNDTVTVTLDSTQKVEWKSNLLVGLELYPFGRDIDNFKPIWKAPFKKFYERIGVMGGIKLSKNPLDSYYYGACLSLAKGLTVTVGLNYTNQYKNQVAYLPNVTSVSDAKEYLKKEYEKNIYFGIFLSPGQMAKTLGLKKKQDK